MDTNVGKNSRTASQLQPAVGGEIVLYQPDNNIRLEVQLDPDSQVVVRENRTTTRHGAIEDKTQVPSRPNKSGQRLLTNTANTKSAPSPLLSKPK